MERPPCGGEAAEQPHRGFGASSNSKIIKFWKGYICDLRHFIGLHARTCQILLRTSYRMAKQLSLLDFFQLLS